VLAHERSLIPLVVILSLKIELQTRYFDKYKCRDAYTRDNEMKLVKGNLMSNAHGSLQGEPLMSRVPIITTPIHNTLHNFLFP
jgi:hypothetical protein